MRNVYWEDFKAYLFFLFCVILYSHFSASTLPQKSKKNFQSVFPLSRFFSANQRFVGARVNNFWQYCKQSFRKFNKFVKYDFRCYFNTGLVQNLGHVNLFLELWAQLFKENLGTRQLAINLDGTQLPITRLC